MFLDPGRDDVRSAAWAAAGRHWNASALLVGVLGALVLVGWWQQGEGRDAGWAEGSRAGYSYALASTPALDTCMAEQVQSWATQKGVDRATARDAIPPEVLTGLTALCRDRVRETVGPPPWE